MNKRRLLLEDNTAFIGTAFGGNTTNIGNVVFYSGMTGYQEILSDPSYAGLLVTFTYPYLGAAGINRDDFESIRPHVSGVIAKEIAKEPSNFRGKLSLNDYLKQNNIPGIMDIDTRMLTRKIRTDGPLKGIITDDLHRTFTELNEEIIGDKTGNSTTVATKEPYVIPGSGKRLIVIDLGIKQTVLRELAKKDFHMTVVPPTYKVEKMVGNYPEGVIVSHGPGNPEDFTETEIAIRSLLGKVPILALGLGHQLFARACACSTKEAQVGRFGTNYPVKDIATDKTWITTQSSSYVVTEASVNESKVDITHRSVNNNDIEGLSHKKHPALSVQFNIEGSPGSNETNHLLDTFISMMNRHRKGSEHLA